MRFRLGSIPIHVHPSFLVLALLGGYRDVASIAAWTVAAFVAVLAHEMGHALTVRAFGVRQVRVMLFALGGVTTYPAEPRLSSGRQFLVSAAGSAVGIALGGTVFLLGRTGMFSDWPFEARVFLSSFVWVGAVFGIFNWLPIRPLDGSQMLRSVLEAVVPRRVEPISLGVHLVTGAAAAIAAYVYLDSFLVPMFVLLITLSGLNRGGPAPAQRDPAKPAPSNSRSGHQSTEDPGPPSPPPRRPPPEFPI